MSFHPNTLPLGRGNSNNGPCFTIFGRQFTYKAGDRQDERRAEREAQQFAAAQKQRREDLCGRPLSTRELFYSEKYADKDDPRDLRTKINNQSTTVRTQEDTTNVNPHAYRLQELQSMVVYTPAQRAQRDRRIALAQAQSDAWEYARVPREEAPNQGAITSATNHAKMIQQAIIDSTETDLEDVELAAQRLRIAQTEPARYSDLYNMWKADFDSRVEAKAMAALSPVAGLLDDADRIRGMANLPKAPTYNPPAPEIDGSAVTD
jgi:hypothetical protein